MTSQGLEQQIHEQLRHLPFEQQRQVLDFARALVVTRTRGTPGRALLRFAGAINVEDLAIMAQAIEKGCEKVDADEW